MGRAQIRTENDQAFTDPSSWIQFYGMGIAGDRFIHWDNPYIGSNS